MSEPSARSVMRRNVALLALCQAIANISTGVLLAMAALVGYFLATDKSIATLPHAIQWEAVAAFAIPTAMMMRRLGRRDAFTVGALLGCGAALVGALSIYAHQFWIYVAATTVFGCFNATAQHLRFAAAEVADEAFRPIAISLVIGAAVVAAFVGPEIAKWTWQAIPGYDFLGTFLVLAVIPVFIILAVRFVTFPPRREASPDNPPRPTAEIARQPGFIVAVLCATIGWGVMVLMMSATPIAMKAEFGFGVRDAMFVVQWHMFGMFAPGFISGWLITRAGLLNVLLMGLALTIAAAVLGLFANSVASFAVANLCVGAGWNFLFVGGTTLLTHVYRPGERSRAQGLNDMLVFQTVALFSFVAGWIQVNLGWGTVCWIIMPFIGAVALAVLWLKFTPGAAPETLDRAAPRLLH